MQYESFRSFCSEIIAPESELVKKHLQVLEEMVRIDSRSFGVNEFEGDRTTPSDMREILECARNYLLEIGLSRAKINDSPSSGSFPILMAEKFVSETKPTVLFYAHLDKQPYMDDGSFKKWGGIPPTQLRWNEDRSRAYGRGAADDLSGVVSIGMAIDALFRNAGFHRSENNPEKLSHLPCNIKIIFETEEESGSHSLIDQIQENQEFFRDADCVVITDVVNPSQGKPGLTTSLRGIIQLDVTVNAKEEGGVFDEQTALYKLLATLIRSDHSLAIREISGADQSVADAERAGYARVPTSLSALKETAGLLPGVGLTVPEDIPSILIAQFRTSYVNARPGHRVTGSVILGVAGARLTFSGIREPKEFKGRLEKILTEKNHFNLEIKISTVSEEPLSVDILLRSAKKDPHSGVNGGPVPVPELQLACMVDELVSNSGRWHSQIEELRNSGKCQIQALRVDHNMTGRLFEEKSARSWIEIRLGPGNNEVQAEEALRNHLEKNIPSGFELDIKADKGASPWMTEIAHPVFPLIMDCLEKGFGEEACLYGCGGTIPFVAKLMHALRNIHPLCLGAYDPDARMHEPGESLSMPDLLGCTRSILHFLSRIDEVYGKPVS